MSVEIAWKQNILVTDFHLLKSLLVVLGFGSQAFICGFSRQNINSADFEQSVNPISTNRADYVHHITSCPPHPQIFRSSYGPAEWDHAQPSPGLLHCNQVQCAWEKNYKILAIKSTKVTLPNKRYYVKVFLRHLTIGPLLNN